MCNKFIKSIKSERGGFSAGGILSVALFAMILTTLLHKAHFYESQKIEAIAAGQMKNVLNAATSYVQANYTSLEAAATATNAAAIPFTTLVSSGFLPSTSVNRNIWGQSYALYVLEPQNGILQAIVLTSGGRGHDTTNTEFGNYQIPATAKLIGANGGFIPSGDLPSEPNSILQGNGWSFAFAGTTVPNPGSGHLGGMIWFANGTTSNDFLHRVQVPGRPELNEMQTDLAMKDNAITNVKEVHFANHTLINIDPASFCADVTKEGRVFYNQSEGLYLCRDGNARVILDTENSVMAKNKTLAANNDLISKPECPSGTNTNPQIFITPMVFAKGAIASPIEAVQGWAIDEGLNWRIKLRILDPSGSWTEPSAGYGRLNVETVCE